MFVTFLATTECPDCVFLTSNFQHVDWTYLADVYPNNPGTAYGTCSSSTQIYLNQDGFQPCCCNVPTGFSSPYV